MTEQTNQPQQHPSLSPISPLTPPDGWLDRCRELGVSFEPGEVESLGRYLAMLLDENTRMNLTAVREPAEAWDRHILDAMTLLGVLGEVQPEQAAEGAGSQPLEFLALDHAEL